MPKIANLCAQPSNVTPFPADRMFRVQARGTRCESVLDLVGRLEEISRTRSGLCEDLRQRLSLLCEPPISKEREDRYDRIATLLANRAKREIQKWQDSEGLPDEQTMLVKRLKEIASCSNGLNASAVKQLRKIISPQMKAKASK